MKSRGLRTAEIAAAAGVTPSAVRYYERRGLLPDPGRTESGYRSYPPSAADTVRFIKRAQAVGFTLREIRQLLAARDDGDGCSAMCGLAERKIAELEETAQRAIEQRLELERVVADRPRRPRGLASCPVAVYLEDLDAPRRSRSRP